MICFCSLVAITIAKARRQTAVGTTINFNSAVSHVLVLNHAMVAKNNIARQTIVNALLEMVHAREDSRAALVLDGHEHNLLHVGFR